MTKADLVNEIAQEAGITKVQAEKALSAFTQSVTRGLAAGEKVTLVGFGTFATSRREARPGRNPKTREPMEIPASTAVRFSAGSALRESVNS